MFHWSKEDSSTSVSRKRRAISREDKRLDEEESCRRNSESTFDDTVEVAEESVHTSVNFDEMVDDSTVEPEMEYFNAASQTASTPMFSADNFIKDDTGIHFTQVWSRMLNLCLLCEP